MAFCCLVRAKQRSCLHGFYFRFTKSRLMLRLPKRVDKHEKGAIPAFRIHKGEHYKIDETKCVEGSVLLEPPSIPDINTGEFEALSEKGDVLGVYVGHDHKNSYVGKVGNIDVGFTQSAVFNVYGNGKQRGVRCFVLDENDPRNYKTYTKTYEQLSLIHI